MSKQVLSKTDTITREEWLKLRLKGIGGSDAAAVCNLSRYTSALDVWLFKTGRKGATPDNEAMLFGRLLEPVIRKEFERRAGLSVVECPYMFAFKEYPFMCANIDGVVTEKDGTKALLEIKTTNSSTTTKELEEGVPVEWYIQMQHYMAVCNLPIGYLAVLVGGNKLYQKKIERDEETIQTLIGLESHFWKEYVEKDVPPPVDANSGEALSLLYPSAEKGSTVALPSEADEMVAQWLEIKKAEEEIKTAKATCENQLKALLKDTESGITKTGYTVRWTSYQSSRVDTTKLKTEQPDIAAQYTVQTSTRKFSIVGKK